MTDKGTCRHSKGVNDRDADCHAEEYMPPIILRRKGNDKKLRLIAEFRKKHDKKRSGQGFHRHVSSSCIHSFSDTTTSSQGNQTITIKSRHKKSPYLYGQDLSWCLRAELNH